MIGDALELGKYLGICGRYIERNPVRVALAESAQDYQWSSAPCYVLGKSDPITDINPYLDLRISDDASREW